MPLCFIFSADQSFANSITHFSMPVGLRLLIAAIRMLMQPDLRQITHQYTGVPAGLTMFMHDVVCAAALRRSFGVTAGRQMGMYRQCFIAAGKPRNLLGSDLYIASFGMYMFFPGTTISQFHGNGGNDQGISYAKHHNASHHADKPAPDTVLLIEFQVASCP